jgi:hypothetical protein
VLLRGKLLMFLPFLVFSSLPFFNSRSAAGPLKKVHSQPGNDNCTLPLPWKLFTSKIDLERMRRKKMKIYGLNMSRDMTETEL